MKFFAHQTVQYEATKAILKILKSIKPKEEQKSPKFFFFKNNETKKKNISSSPLP